MYVDTHCHLQLLDYPALNMGMDDVVQQAIDNNVLNLLCVATHTNQAADLYAIADKYVNVNISMGLHPNEEIDIEPKFDDYIKLLAHDSVIAIGETGLDYFRTEGVELLKIQQERFRTQIKVALSSKKPLIVHTRAAKEDTIKILTEEGASGIGGVLHCFTEDLDMAMRAIDLNFLISFSGIVTFKNAKQIQEVAKTIPLSKILIETDSPYLAPEPKRGSTNLPANVSLVAEYIAKLRGIDAEEVALQTTKNYHDLFLAQHT